MTHLGEERRRKDAARKKKQRDADRVVIIPKCKNKRRRTRLEKDDIGWLMWYFGPGCGLDERDCYTYEFTDQQKEMAIAVRNALKYGGDQALAASRGEGKTTLARRLLLKFILSGEVDFAALFGANASKADEHIEAIDQAVTENQRLIDDYPEVCVPVIELENAPQKARTQKASGSRHDNGKPYEMADLKYSWCGHLLTFPRVPGSPASGSIVAAFGLDGAIKGMNKRGKRPKICVIDDPDTEETTNSEQQAQKLTDRINRAIGGLGGQGRPVGRVMLTTIPSRISVSYRFTDRKQQPTFKGRRFKFMIQKPERMDLWEEYISLRAQDFARQDDNGNDLDPFARRAHQFYLDHRAEMDAGAIVSNPHRFDRSILPDGSQAEVSAIQRYFNEYARLKPEGVATELDNDPPELAAISENDLNPLRIQRQVSGLDRRIVPQGTVCITQGIDVRKVALHWVVRAWLADGTGFTIDYGVHEIYGTVYGSDFGVDTAITNAIITRMEKARAAVYATAEGQTRQIDLTLVDAGWKADAVYAACLQLGEKTIRPLMGFGKSNGCTQANFHDVFRLDRDKRPGDGWFLSRKPLVWLVCTDADRWKNWEHDRWRTSPDQPGTMMLFGQQSPDPDRLSEDQKSHHTYAKHLCAEHEVDEFIRGMLRRVWRQNSKENHWLDASCYSNVAANMLGVKLSTSAAAQGNAMIRTFQIPKKRRV